MLASPQSFNLETESAMNELPEPINGTNGSITILLLLITLLLQSLTFQHLWNWFLAKKFGWNPFKFLEALGVTLLLYYLISGHHILMMTNENPIDVVEIGGKAVVGSATALLFLSLAWCVKRLE